MSITMSSGHAESSQSLESLHPCRQFTIAKIHLVTDNFDESLVIGRGGFGKVYRGTITHGVTRLDVAVKRLDTTSNQGALEFRAEVKMLSQLRHCHLVSLIGYCNDIQEMILVYEFMPHGSLEDHLHKLLAPLTWVRRLKICIGAAHGLAYLHTGTGIKHGVIHRDVKSSNILLDDTWAAKISDFGLSKIGPINQPSTYVNTIVKVLCEKRAVDGSLDEDQWGLASWAKESIKEGRLKQIVDPNISEKISPRCLKEFAQLAVDCSHSYPKHRPTMAQVIVTLEGILALQEKEDDRLQARGMTIFGKKMSTFGFPRENSVGVGSLKAVELYLGTIQGENQQLRRFHFDTITTATGQLSATNRIFDRSDGSIYKGTLQTGQDITIFIPYSPLINKQLINEVSILVELKHNNLIELVGYCIERGMVLLVYNFATHANLDRMIHDRLCTLLDWNKRYQILLGVARALVYLHKQVPAPIIHGDLNPTNIVLDGSFYPKLSNFGVASKIEDTDYSHGDRVRETWGYFAPELCARGCLSTKVDVYSFGVLVLETITGRHVSEIYDLVEYDEYQVKTNWSQGTTSFIIDPRIDVDASPIDTFIKIGLLCIQYDPTDRPTMEEVVDMFLDESSVFLFLQKRGKTDVRRVYTLYKCHDYDTVAADDLDESYTYPR
ncbi:receptor like protein kinase S.2-like isoform X2 [Rutidosis leptorrhynchoides]|uniref:receptor like protein kinase S.2-like isoform X2 n=1 Tax=Rutidosis leptorrhynchoides TaxID=125765 RepID=UPI003A9945FA